MLARLAASAHNSQSADDEAAIEKYLRSVLSLENILTLDRLRQVDGQTGIVQYRVSEKTGCAKNTASLLEIIYLHFTFSILYFLKY